MTGAGISLDIGTQCEIESSRVLVKTTAGATSVMWCAFSDFAAGWKFQSTRFRSDGQEQAAWHDALERGSCPVPEFVYRRSGVSTRLMNVFWERTTMEMDSGTRIKTPDLVKPDRSRRRLFSLLASIAVGAVVFGLTLWVSQVVTTAEHDSAQVRFDASVNRVQTAIRNRMAAYEQVLRGGVALFNASVQVDRNEWMAYVATLDVAKTYPGIQGIGFSKRVLPVDRDQHIRQVRSQGFPDYTLWPEGERDVYTAIVFLEPFDFRNKRAFGYDMMSQSTRREAMERARDRGIAAVSGKVTLKQETNAEVQAGFLTYLPVYKAGMPVATVENRRTALFGYVYSPFRMNDLMRGILGQDELDVALTIHDGTEVSEQSLTYTSAETPQAAEFNETVLVQLSGRTWTLAIASLPNFESSLLFGKSRAILLAGGLIALLLIAVMWLIMNTRDRALGIAYTMTRSLRKTESDMRELNTGLEQRVAERTSQLDAVNKELESFAFSVSHDLRAPLRSMAGFCLALMEDYSDKLDETGLDYLERISAASKRMGRLIDDLLTLSRVTRIETKRSDINLSAIAESVAEDLKRSEPDRKVEFVIQPDVVAKGDEILLRTVLENLLGNSWKYSAKKPQATIEFGVEANGVAPAFFVRDNGAGFDMAHADKLFKPFQRLHGNAEFEGSGIGLASVANIVRRHGGKIWADAKPNDGAIMRFTLSI